MCAKQLRSHPTLCDPMNCSPPGSSVHGILQAKYWSWLPHAPPGDLPNPGTELTSLTSPTLASRFFTTSATWEALQRLNFLPFAGKGKNSEISHRDVQGQEEVARAMHLTSPQQLHIRWSLLLSQDVALGLVSSFTHSRYILSSEEILEEPASGF